MRMDKLRMKMEEHKLDAFLISKGENIWYLSNFTGGSDASLLITPTRQCIITDGRYFEQVARECPDWELVKNENGLIAALSGLCEGIQHIGIESHYMTVEVLNLLKDELKVEFHPCSNWIETQRLVKDETELEFLRSVAAIGDQVFSQICTEIRPGVPERHIAARIAFLLKEGGCSGESFDTIAVSGKNAALPHGQPSSKELASGDMLTIDMGGFYHGYAGDMTRTVAISEASSKLRDIYGKVLEAQELGVASVCSGMESREVDGIVRGQLKKYDLDRYFVHGLGHGVGLEIHEQPRVSYASDAVLEENMVVTIEPGVYIPGWGGIRIEDTVIVKNGGCEVITLSDKKLIII